MNRDRRNHLELRKVSVLGIKNHRVGAVRVGQVRPSLDPLVYMIKVWLHAVFKTTNCYCIPKTLQIL